MSYPSVMSTQTHLLEIDKFSSGDWHEIFFIPVFNPLVNVVWSDLVGTFVFLSFLFSPCRRFALCYPRYALSKRQTNSFDSVFDARRKCSSSRWLTSPVRGNLVLWRIRLMRNYWISPCGENELILKVVAWHYIEFHLLNMSQFTNLRCKAARAGHIFLKKHASAILLLSRRKWTLKSYLNATIIVENGEKMGEGMRNRNSLTALIPCKEVRIYINIGFKPTFPTPTCKGTQLQAFLKKRTSAIKALRQLY